MRPGAPIKPCSRWTRLRRNDDGSPCSWTGYPPSFNEGRWLFSRYPLPRALERAGRGAGDGVAAVASFAGRDALVHLLRIERAVEAHRADRRGARDVLFRLAAGDRQPEKQY